MTSPPGQPGPDGAPDPDRPDPDPAELGEAIRTGRVPVVPGSLVDLVMRSGGAAPADGAPAPDPGSPGPDAPTSELPGPDASVSGAGLFSAGRPATSGGFGPIRPRPSAPVPSPGGATVREPRRDDPSELDAPGESTGPVGTASAEAVPGPDGTRLPASPVDPSPTEPSPTEPSPTEPSPTEPTATEPAGTESSPSDPSGTETSGTEDDVAAEPSGHAGGAGFASLVSATGPATSFAPPPRRRDPRSPDGLFPVDPEPRPASDPGGSSIEDADLGDLGDDPLGIGPLPTPDGSDDLSDDDPSDGPAGEAPADPTQALPTDPAPARDEEPVGTADAEVTGESPRTAPGPALLPPISPVPAAYDPFPADSRQSDLAPEPAAAPPGGRPQPWPPRPGPSPRPEPPQADTGSEPPAGAPAADAPAANGRSAIGGPATDVIPAADHRPTMPGRPRPGDTAARAARVPAPPRPTMPGRAPHRDGDADGRPAPDLLYPGRTFPGRTRPDRPGPDRAGTDRAGTDAPARPPMPPTPGPNRDPRHGDAAGVRPPGGDGRPPGHRRGPDTGPSTAVIASPLRPAPPDGPPPDEDTATGHVAREDTAGDTSPGTGPVPDRAEAAPAPAPAPAPARTAPPEAIMSATPRRGRGVSPGGLAIGLVAVLLAALTVWAIAYPSTPDSPEPGSAPSVSPAEQALRPVRAPAAASLAEPRVRATLPIAQSPAWAAAAPSGRFTYLAVQSPPRLVVLDAGTDAVAAEVPLPGPPRYVSVSPDGARAYVTMARDDGEDSSIGVVETATNRLLSTVPASGDPLLAVPSIDGRFLFVASGQAGKVDEVDPAAGVVTRSVPVPQEPAAAAPAPDGDRVYLANRGTGLLTVLDPDSLTVLGTYKVSGDAQAVTAAPGGGQIAVAGPDDDTVSIMDPDSGRELTTARVEGGPTALAWAPDGRHLYVGVGAGEAVRVVDTTTWQVVGSVPVDGAPTSVAVGPDGRTGWVTDSDGGTVTVLNLA